MNPDWEGLLADVIPLVDYLVLDGDPHLIAHECERCAARGSSTAATRAPRAAAPASRTVDIPREGTVRTFTIVSVAAPGVPVPFVAARRRLRRAPASAGNLVNVEPDPDHVTLGMKVRLTTFRVGTDAAGVEAIGYGFEPA